MIPLNRKPSLHEVSVVVNDLIAGNGNNTGQVTLTASVASTTVNDPNAHEGSSIVLEPRTANAAAEIAAGTMYITDANRNDGNFVITHANNGQTDRDFNYILRG